MIKPKHVRCNERVFYFKFSTIKRIYRYTVIMNLLFLIIMLAGTVGIFGLPIWYLAKLRGSRHPLWLIAPPVFFIGLFGITRVLESHEMVTLYKLLKPLAYYWMILGMALFGVAVIGFFMQKTFSFSHKKTFWGIIIVTLLFGLSSGINGQRIIVKELVLPADNIIREYNFVHITDLHAGSTDVKHAQKVVNKINPLNPEFMVITGDFIDEFFVGPEDVAPFKQINFPTYLITGNHEYYLETGTIENVISETDIQLIDDMRIEFDELDIIGVNELATVDRTIDVLGGIRDDRYTILLDHQPITEEVERASARGAKLMLSGHTHNGQIWPMGLLVSLRYKYVAGLYEIGDMFLYINQGTGTLGPKMRFGTANEITYITLQPTQ